MSISKAIKLNYEFAQEEVGIVQRYRIECNFGSKYYDTAALAFAYYKRCKARHLDVEIWLVTYSHIERTRTFSASQELLDYSMTSLPKN